MAPASTETAAEEEFDYDINHLLNAATICFGFAFLLPAILWMTTQCCMGMKALTLAEWVCLYIASVSQFTPSELLTMSRKDGNVLEMLLCVDTQLSPATRLGPNLMDKDLLWQVFKALSERFASRLGLLKKAHTAEDGTVAIAAEDGEVHTRTQMGAAIRKEPIFSWGCTPFF